MDCAEAARQDVYGYRSRVHRREEWQYREIEQQLHYMRRRNQSPMAVIERQIPLYQMFTAPKTFGLMWGLDVTQRDDRYYAAILPTLPCGVGGIPWARSGQVLGDESGTADALRKMHHRYGFWLRNELHGFVCRLVDSDEIRRLGVFNECGLDWLLRTWRKAATDSVNEVDEIVSWMASLAVMVKTYNVAQIDKRAKLEWSDRWAARRGQALANVSLAVRNHMRA
jgi:asparagine synthase (glutamine-hydrolysing)